MHWDFWLRDIALQLTAYSSIKQKSVLESVDGTHQSVLDFL